MCNRLPHHLYMRNSKIKRLRDLAPRTRNLMAWVVRKQAQPSSAAPKAGAGDYRPPPLRSRGSGGQKRDSSASASGQYKGAARQVDCAQCPHPSRRPKARCYYFSKCLSHQVASSGLLTIFHLRTLRLSQPWRRLVLQLFSQPV